MHMCVVRFEQTIVQTNKSDMTTHTVYVSHMHKYKQHGTHIRTVHTLLLYMHTYVLYIHYYCTYIITVHTYIRSYSTYIHK